MSQSSSTTGPQVETPPEASRSLVGHIISHKVDVLLWATRIITLFFTALYIVPLFGVNAYTCYQRALLSSCSTSALRLHQRLPAVRFSREFLAQLLLEDSCHYLLYSLIFLYAAPITLALLPIALFALLHSASYSLTLLDQIHQTSWWGARLLISIIEFQQRNILRVVSFTEIILMPLVIVMIFSGRANLVMPFMYYRFLTLRYASRRNPYTRQVFTELRAVTEQQCNRPGCPQIIRNMGTKVIELLSKLAPPMPQ